MQRRAIHARDLKPDASQHVGMLNAEKCIIYLRGIGVEVDDATAAAWLDTQGAYRFLRSEKTLWRRVEGWHCQCGEMEGFAERGPGRQRLKRDKESLRSPPKCEACGSGFVSMSLIFSVRRDGTVVDYRRGVDATIPIRINEWAGGL